MFPSGNQFGGPQDPGGSGFGGSGLGGPPASDSMFEAMLPDEGDDLFDLEEFQAPRRTKDSHNFLAIGLHFFESFRRK